MLDADEAGESALPEIVGRLSRKVWVRSVELRKDMQPDQMTEEEIRTILGEVV